MTMPIPWIALASAVGLGLAGCQTTAQSWTEWTEIPEAESLMEVNVPEGVDHSQIRREARRNTNTSVREETWDWDSGGAFIFVPPRNRFLQGKVNDPSHVLEDLRRWQFLRDIELKADAGMVQRDRNAIGFYHYFISDRNNAGKVCFVFRQMLPTRTAGGFRAISHGVQGVLMVYDCQPSSSVDASQAMQRMRIYAQNIRLRG